MRELERADLILHGGDVVAAPVLVYGILPGNLLEFARAASAQLLM